jgi:hypothetical protein
MAGRNFPNNQYKSNAPEETTIHLRCTAAADVAAEGYAINDGDGFVTSVTRSAEGVMRITLTDRYAKFINAHVLGNRDDSVPQFNAEAVNSATPTVDIVWREGAADKDPDSAEIRVTLVLQNSGLGVY